MLLFSSVAYAANFEVSVTNKSIGSAISDYPVSVHLMKKGSQGRFDIVRSVETRSDTKGNASGEIDTTGGSFVAAEVLYRGVTYRSRILPFPSITGKLSFEVNTFEVTNDGSDVSIRSRKMILITSNNRTLEVFETLEVQSTGTKTFIGKFNNELDMNQVLFIPMPSGYMLSGFSGYLEPKVQTKGKGLVTQNEILPGVNEINFHYYVTSDIGEFDLSLFTEKDAPEIEILTLFFPIDNSWQLKQADLKSVGTQDVRGLPYNIFKGRHSSAVKINVFGPTYKGGFGIWHIAMILAFFVAVVFIYFGRDYIYNLRLRSEESRLLDLLEEFDEETDESEKDNVYAPLIETLRDRLDTVQSKVE
jgi:hypothetical protein